MGGGGLLLQLYRWSVGRLRCGVLAGHRLPLRDPGVQVSTGMLREERRITSRDSGVSSLTEWGSEDGGAVGPGQWRASPPLSSRPAAAERRTGSVFLSRLLDQAPSTVASLTYSAGAAVTKSRRARGVNSAFFAHSRGGWKSKIQAWAGRVCRGLSPGRADGRPLPVTSGGRPSACACACVRVHTHVPVSLSVLRTPVVSGPTLPS